MPDMLMLEMREDMARAMSARYALPFE